MQRGANLLLNGIGIDQVGGPFPHVRQDVSVAAQRHGRIRMTEYIRHGPNVHSAPDHEDAGGDAQVVYLENTTNGLDKGAGRPLLRKTHQGRVSSRGV